MPFLFVDYDQGAGGEYFCYILSKTPQCVDLAVEEFNTGRRKVHDRFGQEFLKPIPKPTTILSHPTLYDVSPSHRKCEIAKKALVNVNTIRISNPSTDTPAWEFLKHQRLKKVLLATQPAPKYFFGELKVLLQRANNTEFLKKVSIDMDNLTLQLLSQNIEPTDENKQKYLEKELIQDPEPVFDYDLTIDYTDLLINADKVVGQIKDKFGIELDIEDLKVYNKDYETFLQKT